MTKAIQLVCYALLGTAITAFLWNYITSATPMGMLAASVIFLIWLGAAFLWTTE